MEVCFSSYCVLSLLGANYCSSHTHATNHSNFALDVIQNILWSWADSGIKGTYIEAETYVHSIHTGTLSMFALVAFHNTF